MQCSVVHFYFLPWLSKKPWFGPNGSKNDTAFSAHDK
jgi:hypothetical protein